MKVDPGRAEGSDLSVIVPELSTLVGNRCKPIYMAVICRGVEGWI